MEIESEETSSISMSNVGKQVHPTYLNMVIDAIDGMKERHGSSRHAILKRIQSIYGITDERAHIRINKALRELAESGAIIAGGAPGRKGSGCFKLPSQHQLRADQIKDIKVVSPVRKGLKMPTHQDVGKKVSKKLQKMGKMRVLQPSRGIKAVKKNKVHAVKQSRQSRRPSYINA
ncbi:histone H1.3 [Eurytemora carolleeae]|uniref:histone H1.3 n=1 Tax=Eurytemora carolleeae TaxID=1294199 RepID=UPI000C77DA61|nr:histone H1.3 [Eurytemora carolleeae]|eukprot:XP_023328918.1 histone H1.3-like [Eurytemora affinis]